jgi:hypothetical protein
MAFGVAGKSLSLKHQKCAPRLAWIPPDHVGVARGGELCFHAPKSNETFLLASLTL